MRRTWPLLLTAVLLSLVGAYVSYNLLATHYTNETGLAWFDEVCEGGEESARSCDKVLASDYGTFPAAPADARPEEKYKAVSVLGLFEMRPRPVALFGLMYFSVLAAWYLAIGRPSRSRRILHLLPLLLNLCGVAGAVYFVYLMFAAMDVWCSWCMVTHVVNGLLLVCAILLWPRKPVVVEATGDLPGQTSEPGSGPFKATASTPSELPNPQPTEASPAASVDRSAAAPGAPGPGKPVAHPSLRLCLVALAGIAAVVAAEWYLGNTAHANELLTYQNNYVAEFNKSAANLMYKLYLSNRKHHFPRRPDDPVKNEDAGRLALVVFSDFRCPHCGSFAEYLAKRVEPLFEGLLRTTFRHFPASKDCNPHVAQDLHPGACVASRAVEAAHVLGGNEAFWRAHDLLFSFRKTPGELDYRDIARQLDLDPDRFVETMDSQAVMDRINEDIELALKVQVDATPALYLSGRRVPRAAVRQMLFWRMAKAQLDKILAAREAKKAQAQKQKDQQPEQPTPGTPGP